MSGFTLRRKLELQLPTSFIEIESDEMEYIDGGGFGKHWYNKVGTVGTVLDGAIIAVTGGAAVSSTYAIRKVIKTQRGTITRAVRKALLKHVGTVSSSAIGSALDFAMTIGGTSIGGIIAEGLDRADGRNDGYVFA